MLTEVPDALQAVRRRHELRVLEALLRQGPRTRRELEADTKLSRTTLSAIVSDLRLRGFLHEQDQAAQGVGRSGRPTKLLNLNSQAGAAVGVELGRARVSVSAVGIDGSPVVQKTLDVPGTMDLAAKVQLAATVLEEWIDSDQLHRQAVLGIGVGVATRHADPLSLADEGGARQREPEGLSLDPLRSLLDVPLLWDNNIRLAALAEASRSPVPSEDLLYVVLSAGISCGVVSNGSLLRGGNGFAGEIGHVSVNFTGPSCWCGGKGCLESYLNVATVLAETERRGGHFDSIAQLAAAARAGDPVGLEVVRWCAELLSRALASACLLLDPRRVVVAGELAQFGNLLLDPAREALASHRLNIGERRCAFTTAKFQPTTGSHGAALMALQHWGISRA